MILSTSIEGEARDIGVCLAAIAREITTREGRSLPPVPSYPAVRPPSRWVAKKVWAGPIKRLLWPLRATSSSPDASRLPRSTRTVPMARPISPEGLSIGAPCLEPATMEIDVVDALRRHRSSQALLDLGDAIVTGHTGTNVMNLRVMLVKDGARVET